MPESDAFLKTAYHKPRVILNPQDQTRPDQTNTVIPPSVRDPLSPPENANCLGTTYAAPPASPISIAPKPLTSRRSQRLIHLPLLHRENRLPGKLPYPRLQRAGLVQLRHIVAAADAEALHEHIRHGAPARHVGEARLQCRAQDVLVELDDVGGGRDGVFLEEDGLGAAGVRAVGFGEDDDLEGGC